MQKLGLHIGLQQKLSPQQIQFIKLLEVPSAELNSRIEEELEINPALEEGLEFENTEKSDSEDSNDDFNENEGIDEENEFDSHEEISLSEYLNDDDASGYKMQGDGHSDDDTQKDLPMTENKSVIDYLINQLSFLRLDERQHYIGLQLIGSIDEEGYLRRDLEAIINDLAFSQNIETDLEELESILFKIQEFDPAGIAARNLAECLLLQIKRKNQTNPAVIHATYIIEHKFEEFTKKHYDKIIKKLNIEESELKSAIKVITKCNPKPGGGNESMISNQYLLPDFMVINNNQKLEVSLNSINSPELRVSPHYHEMMAGYEKSIKKDPKMKDAVMFVKQKLDSAKWFIDAIRQRQNTLLANMQAVVSFQYDFFLDGDESKLKPMILKDVAEIIKMDISTVSRVMSSKSVQTEFGVYPLKYFFSEGISSDLGDDVSSREVKNIVTQIIAEEDKQKPIGDEAIEKLLKEKGFNIARRTIAKYREQLNIPVARLRKEI